MRDALRLAEQRAAEEAGRAAAAQAMTQSYVVKFDDVQSTMKENLRSFEQLRQQISSTGRKNKTVMKENSRLSACLSSKCEELASVKAQFEKFLRRGERPPASSPPPPVLDDKPFMEQPGSAAPASSATTPS
uniref:Uncharacterized protein n=2 Tax=Spongospora subterranea TaxID=70186 RepID=A0A0H5QHU0_9EUKA|eukprot:CRZ01217.1 hypothetical protein [Spongospora subterranea]